MAIKYFNEPPYYDDFDESKNYMRILFRPGYAIQARELTQLQTSIQAQIDRFGRWAFKEGSPVVGGLTTLDNRYAYIKIYSSFTYTGSSFGSFTTGQQFPTTGGANDPDDYADEFLGKTITGLTTGVTAKVLQVVDATTEDSLTLYVKYTSGGDDNETQVFAPGEYFTSDGIPVRMGQVRNLATVDPTNGDNAPTGYGTRFSITEGAFFVAGNFVYTPSESILVSKYDSRPSARVVFKITQSVITSSEDATLTDNALGTPNEAAPGAHRYQIALDLQIQSIALANRDENDIIQLMVIENGQKREEVRVQLNELGKTLAQRTYEESGNYTVRPFQIDVREYINENDNGGVYTWQQIIDADRTDEITTRAQAETYGRSKIAVGLEPAVAYVNGYRIETVSTKYVELDRARDEAFVNGAATLAALGNYITVDNISGLPDINSYKTMNLLDGPVGATGTGTIGTARARGFEYVSGSGAAAIYKLYLFDVVMNTGEVFSSVVAVQQTLGGGAPQFTAETVSTTFADSGNNSLVFPLPVGTVQTLRSQDGSIDIFYNTVRKHSTSPTTVSGGSITLNTTFSNEKFTTTTGWILCNSSGTIRTPSSITLGSGGSSITFNGLTNGETLYIIGPSLQNLREKTKRVQRNHNVAITTPDNVYPNFLGVTDVLKVSAIYMSPNLSTPATTSHTNVTSRYIIDTGQRDNFYDEASVKLKAGAPAATGRLLVVCDYFIHSTGDYFSVDSYVDVDYSEIPSYQSSRGTVQLRDALDFRPTKDTTGTVATGGVVAGGFDTANGAVLVRTGMIQPNTVILADIQYYLPRIDKVWLDSKGNFGVTKGISATNPKAPDNPKDAMVLYTIGLNAYTFSPNDVNITFIDNRRFTMRDIGSLEKRISKLEYYTSLNLLEQNANSAQIFDNSGFSRFKNGFVVDGFVGSNVGAVTHPDYRAATDKSTGTLRPMFREDNVRLIWNPSASSGYRRTGSLLTLDYYQADGFIQQPYSSRFISVNPYGVYNWGGKLQLSPGADEWKETTRAPDVVIDQSGIYDALIGMPEGSNAIGTVWNEWQTNWIGDSISTDESPLFSDDQAASQGFQTINTTTTRTTRTGQTRTGLVSTVVPDTVKSVVGDRVVEVNFVPFIRSRKIYFRATQMKPNTRVYPFFDGIDVSAWCATETNFFNYADRTDVTSYTGVEAASLPAGYGDPLVTDAAGTLVGSFIIPNNSTIAFRTGTRIFRLVDSPINTTRSGTITTWAEAAYVAQGAIETVANQIISTTTPRIQYTEVAESRVVTDVQASSNSSTVSVTTGNQAVSPPDPVTTLVDSGIPQADAVDVVATPISTQPALDPVPTDDTNTTFVVPTRGVEPPPILTQFGWRKTAFEDDRIDVEAL